MLQDWWATRLLINPETFHLWIGLRSLHFRRVGPISQCEIIKIAGARVRKCKCVQDKLGLWIMPLVFTLTDNQRAVGVDWGSEWSISIFPSVPCSQMQTRNHQNSLRRLSSVCRLIFLHTSCMKHEFLSDFRELAVSSPILDMIKRKYGEMTVP